LIPFKIGFIEDFKLHVIAAIITGKTTFQNHINKIKNHNPFIYPKIKEEMATLLLQQSLKLKSR
jgi:hypothetical protein